MRPLIYRIVIAGCGGRAVWSCSFRSPHLIDSKTIRYVISLTLTLFMPGRIMISRPGVPHHHRCPADLAAYGLLGDRNLRSSSHQMFCLALFPLFMGLLVLQPFFSRPHAGYAGLSGFRFRLQPRDAVK